MKHMTTGQLVVPLSKTKLILLISGAVGFVALGVWLWSIAEYQTRYNPLYMKAVAVTSAGFFGVCGIYGFVKLFDTAPGLIIDSEGIVDNSSGVSAGRIPWREIRGITVTSLKGQKFLTFEVENPQKYVERGNFLKHQLNAVNLKYFGSPIQIAANSLQIRFDELHKIVVEFHDRYKGA